MTQIPLNMRCTATLTSIILCDKMFEWNHCSTWCLNETTVLRDVWMKPLYYVMLEWNHCITWCLNETTVLRDDTVIRFSNFLQALGPNSGDVLAKPMFPLVHFRNNLFGPNSFRFSGLHLCTDCFWSSQLTERVNYLWQQFFCLSSH